MLRNVLFINLSALVISERKVNMLNLKFQQPLTPILTVNCLQKTFSISFLLSSFLELIFQKMITMDTKTSDDIR